MQVVILFQINSKLSAKPEHKADSAIIILSSGQLTSRDLYQIYQVDTQKCFNTKSDPHIALLQIRSTPLGPGLPSSATLLFNHPIRDVMSILTRQCLIQIIINSIIK